MVIDRLFTLAILHIGVPHAVIFLDKKDALNAKIDPAFVVKYGPVIEKDIKFPNGTNVNFAVILDQNHLLASTWERGAGSTLACGTGACASAVAANRLEGMDQGIEVRMPGGDLFISISDDRRISLEGPAQTICKGTY
jgi:diaminopimelate epimerase